MKNEECRIRSGEAMNIFGISLMHLSRKDVLARAQDFVLDGKFHQIATVNPEFLLEARKNEEFKKVLQSCDMRVADGFGVTLAHWLRGRRAPQRYPGADLMMDLLRLANERKLSVFLACRADGLSSYEDVRIAILKRFPNIEIGGANINIQQSNFTYSLPTTNYSLTFCNLGSPYQEFFLASLKSRGATGLAMGVGGAFDYLTGKQKRAPLAMRRIGLEWLWRLGMQPQRIKRIWRAVIVFPLFSILKEKL